jgi:predicted nucleotide-binding protein (sugar kinase/HSP70/actin superfamily)
MPIENEPLQSEIFFATEFVSDIIADMLDNLYRDYLIERIVDMTNRLERGKTEQRERTREGMRLTSRSPRGTEEQVSVQATDIAISEKVRESGMQDQLFGRGTSIYPRLNLSIGQRFASKGIYIVTYEPSKSDLMPHLNKVSDWLIPN